MSSSAGEITETSWPSSISASARSLMCCCTPPGTSHEYGQVIPIFMARSGDAGTWAAEPGAG